MLHAAALPTPVLVARNLDATDGGYRDSGCLVVWQARAALVDARCGSRASAHLWKRLAMSGANADRPGSGLVCVLRRDECAPAATELFGVVTKDHYE